MNGSNGGGTADRLLSYIQRVEKLTLEKRAIAADISDVFKEAKNAGFDVKVMRAMVREREMTAQARAEWQALCETYRAALGMLDGTPLGEAARRRLMGAPPPGEEPAGGDGEDPGDPLPFQPPLDPPAPDAPAAPSEEDILAARAQGAAAAKADRKVSENPYPHDDPRRAAWDEGWCSAAGSDGMDIPSAFRRSKPRGDGKGKPA